MSVQNVQQAREAVLSLIRMASPSHEGWRIPGHLIEPLALAFLRQDAASLGEYRYSNNPLLSFVAEQLSNAINDLVAQAVEATKKKPGNTSAGDQSVVDLPWLNEVD